MRVKIYFICVSLQSRRVNRRAVWLLIFLNQTLAIIANSNHKDAERNVFISLVCSEGDLPTMIIPLQGKEKNNFHGIIVLVLSRHFNNFWNNFYFWKKISAILVASLWVEQQCPPVLGLLLSVNTKNHFMILFLMFSVWKLFKECFFSSIRTPIRPTSSLPPSSLTQVTHRSSGLVLVRWPANHQEWTGKIIPTSGSFDSYKSGGKKIKIN